MKIIETKAYSFEELSDAAKVKALEWQRECNYNDMWAENTIDDCKEIGALMGVNIDNIYFSVDGGQGDGACFTGSYKNKKGCVNNLKEYAPLDKELHRIVKQLQLIQGNNFYSLTATVGHKGRYFHDKCTEIFVERSDEKLISGGIQTEYALINVLREFMQWIYKALSSAYDDEFSDDNCAEFLEDNYHYLFTADGEAIKDCF
jgi:hypothetical protein